MRKNKRDFGGGSEKFSLPTYWAGPVAAGAIAALLELLTAVEVPSSDKNMTATGGPLLLEIIAASDLGMFRAKASDVPKCVKAYRRLIEAYKLRRNEVGQARVYAANYRQIATVSYDGIPQFVGRAR